MVSWWKIYARWWTSLIYTLRDHAQTVKCAGDGQFKEFCPSFICIHSVTRIDRTVRVTRCVHGFYTRNQEPYIYILSFVCGVSQWLSVTLPQVLLRYLQRNEMPPSKKSICNGCSAYVANRVTWTSCGIISHPGSKCLIRCSHPWTPGKLLDCMELPTTANPMFVMETEIFSKGSVKF